MAILFFFSVSSQFIFVSKGGIDACTDEYFARVPQAAR